MRAVVQRVTRASVRVDGKMTGEIGRGLLVLLGIGKSDTETDSEWMINKLLNLRIFPDDAKNMNRSVTDIGGSLLIVSQFTLYGDAGRGTRPSFSDAMPPADAEKFYNSFMVKLRAATTLPVAEGKFAAMMNVELVNDGPVTILLDSRVGQPSRLSDPPSPERTGETPVPLFTPFDPRSPAEITERHLPHWRQDGCTYFVTFRLADSLPRIKLEQWEAERQRWQADHPEPLTAEQREEHQKHFPNRLEQWLDDGHGECWLRRPDAAAIVATALRHFDGDRYQLGSFVIMPNHVHVLVTPLGSAELADILHSWKSYTAHQINQLLQRKGPVWQDENFDHIVRSEHGLQQFEEYIGQNPTRAGLSEGEYRVEVGQPSRLSPPNTGQAGRPSH